MKNYIGKEDARKMRNLFSGAVPFILGMGLLLASCKDFYSTSWGEAFVRDPSKVNVTSSNVYELLKDANGDTEASREILKKLKGTDDPSLQAAAVKAANQAAGLTELALSNLGELTGANADNVDSLEKLAKTILGEITKNDVKGIAGDIVGTLPVSSDSSSGPVFEGSAVNSVSTSDLTLLLVTMMLAEVPDLNAPDPFGEYAKRWGDELKIDGQGDISLNDEEKVIAAIANEVIKRPDSELGKMLKNLVGAI
jgi:hypothetical protein